MTDREKVIKESEEAIDILAKAEEPTFWLDFVRCAFENALAMLKIQETARAIREFPDDFSYDGGSWWYECGNCQNPVDYHDVFCSYCGKRLVWDAGQGTSDKRT